VRNRIVMAVVVAAMSLATAGLAVAGGGGDLSATAKGAYAFRGEAAGSFFVIDPFKWHVDVWADGTARGNYRYTQVRDGVQLDVSGSLHCATVIGNQLWVGGIIEESSRPTLVGLDMWFQVQDNGKGKLEPPDMSTTIGAGGPGTAQQYCNDHPQVLFPFFLDRGDLKVRSD
jgi:hypothetical protein